jgi:hypothetical protein
MKGIVKASYGNLDRGILQAIGLAVVNYSLLEESLGLGVSWLIVGTRHDEATDLMVRGFHFRVRLETFAGLFRQRFPDDDFSDLNKIFSELETLNKERVNLFHSFWTPGEAADQLSRSRKKLQRDGPKIWEQSVREADVLRFADQAEQLANRLLEFIGERILPRIDDVMPKPRRSARG